MSEARYDWMHDALDAVALEIKQAREPQDVFLLAHIAHDSDNAFPLSVSGIMEDATDMELSRRRTIYMRLISLAMAEVVRLDVKMQGATHDLG